MDQFKLKSEEKDRFNGWVSSHKMFIVDYYETHFFLIIFGVVRWSFPLNFNTSDRTVYLNQQIGLNTEVHSVIFSLFLVDDIAYFNFGIFLFDQLAFIRVLYLSFLDDVILLHSVLASVVFYIYPKLVLIPKYFKDIYLVFTLFQCFNHEQIKFRLPFFFCLLVLLVQLCQNIVLSSIQLILDLIFDKLQVLILLFLFFYYFFVSSSDFFLNFLLFLTLEMYALHDQLSFDRQQMLYQGWLGDQLQSSGMIHIIDEIFYRILEFGVILQIHNVHFSLIIDSSLCWLDELIVLFVIIVDKMVQFAIVWIQSLQNSSILFLFNVQFLERIQIEFSIVNIEFIFFDLHVNKLQHFLGKGTKLIELHLLPVQLFHF